MVVVKATTYPGLVLTFPYALHWKGNSFTFTGK